MALIEQLNGGAADVVTAETQHGPRAEENAFGAAETLLLGYGSDGSYEWTVDDRTFRLTRPLTENGVPAGYVSLEIEWYGSLWTSIELSPYVCYRAATIEDGFDDTGTSSADRAQIVLNTLEAQLRVEAARAKAAYREARRAGRTVISWISRAKGAQNT